MAAQRQLRPDPQPRQRPQLRLVQSTAAQAEPVGLEFFNGLKWGLVVSTLGFWLPVATALYVWLA
jgi:hypothetical protein